MDPVTLCTTLPSHSRLNTSAGNPVKEILLKLNLPDHRILKDGGEVKEFQRSFRHSDTERLSRSDEVLKLKNFKKDATLKLFKSTNQERSTFRIPPNLDDGNSTPLQLLELSFQDFRWLFYKIQLSINSDLFQRYLQYWISQTLLKVQYVEHVMNTIQLSRLTIFLPFFEKVVIAGYDSGQWQASTTQRIGMKSILTHQ
ncbi:hypothetical protein Tco_0618249 [Tanacetum coccineum]